MNAGPSIGETMTPFSGTDIHGKLVSIPSSDDRDTVLVFVSSTCPACEELAPALRSIAEHEKDDLKIVLATFNGDDAKNHAYATKHGLKDVEFVLSPDLANAFSVLTAPYAVLIDRVGVIRSKGLVNSREQLESLLNTVDEGFESMQAYRFAQEGASIPTDSKTLAPLKEKGLFSN